VARGDVVVQFAPLGDRAPITADATERTNLPAESGPDVRCVRVESGCYGLRGGNVPRHAGSCRGPGKGLPAMIDCVITMEPAPPAPPAQDTRPVRLYTYPMNIVFIGYLRLGAKTSIGKRLASKLWMDFVDTDVLIVERAGRTIREIFAAEGEEGFRRRESEVIASAAARG